jgi:hypothetical protein
MKLCTIGFLAACALAVPSAFSQSATPSTAVLTARNATEEAAAEFQSLVDSITDNQLATLNSSSTCSTKNIVFRRE